MSCVHTRYPFLDVPRVCYTIVRYIRKQGSSVEAPKHQPVALVALPNETDLCRLMLATDHARADKARLALVVGGCRVMGARLVLALLCRARVVKLEDRRPPQQGNTLATGGRLAGYA